MGAPESGIQAAEQGTADTLLSSFRTIRPAERAKHANIVDYWLSIRGDKDFPPLHDLDPLEISDAGPSSILLELISGGQDAEIRHLGEALNEFCTSTRIIDAPNPSILHSIARKLPIVAISRDILAYEDDFSGVAGRTRCWVTLLPLSSCGSWVDYVYAFVSVETAASKAAEAADASKPMAEAVTDETGLATGTPIEEPVEALDLAPFVAAEAAPEAIAEPEKVAAPIEVVESTEPEQVTKDAVEVPTADSAPGFSTLLQDVAKLAGFYGQGIPTETIVPTMELTDSTPPESEAPAVEPVEEVLPVLELDEVEPAAEAEEPVLEQESPEVAESEPEPATAPEPAPAVEGALQKQLSEVRAMGEEARQAQIRATAALYEGLSAAYDFALDAETSPDEYFRLVQEKGLKVQLRAPMAPVAKLAFDGVCDAETIAEFEAILAWALKEELPRGTLGERIDKAGGISELLSGVSRPS